jgi:hypothetical protein
MNQMAFLELAIAEGLSPFWVEAWGKVVQEISEVS